MRLRIAHSTSYRYEPPATGVIQILRMTPGSHDGQYVAEWQIDVSTDSRLDVHQDAFGNVTHVLTHGPIADLTINVEGLIETHDTGGVLQRHRRAVSAEPVPALDVADRSQSGDGDVCPRAALGIRERRARIPACADDADQRAHDLRRRPDQQRHLGGGSLRGKRGVCQDYAHIFIACARSGGVPARFVAGHFLRSDGMVNQQAGHAWAEAFVPDLGWVGFDPANAICTTDAHARVAIGLDYLGAAPVRGTRYGGGMETLTVAVKVDQAGRQGQWQSQS